MKIKRLGLLALLLLSVTTAAVAQVSCTIYNKGPQCGVGCSDGTFYGMSCGSDIMK